jgi:hypothetical protein
MFKQRCTYEKVMLPFQHWSLLKMMLSFHSQVLKKMEAS